MITYGDLATFHLPPGGRLLRCAPAELHAPAWRRFLLDTALGTASLIQGFEAIHAGDWLEPDGVTAVVATTVVGKSTLVGEMMRLGRALCFVYVLALSRCGSLVPVLPCLPVMLVLS